MRAARWIAALWPGLSQAWVLGCWRGLALATMFAVALNLAVVATLVWPRWPQSAPAGFVGSMAWIAVLGLWVWGAIWLRRDWAKLFPTRSIDAVMDSKFSQAQQAYLRGHWQEAEALVSEILNQRPMDVEARLLRASIQRRDARLADAHKTLDELLNEPAAAKWQMEIRAELKQMGESEHAVLAGAAKAA